MLLARRARELKRHLPGAIAGEGKGVHRARVASRRLREAVPVLASQLKGSKAGKARRKIRRLTRALGSVREIDVTLALLDEMAARETLPRLALEEVRARVVAVRDEGRERMLKRLEKVDFARLQRRLQSVSKALEQDETEPWRKALATRLFKRSKALGVAVENAGHVYAPERLHVVRIAAKKLRYAVELGADAGIKGAAVLARTLRKAQNTLGQLHDLQVLLAHVAAVQAEPARRPATDAGLEIIAGALERECRHLHGRYVALIPALQQVVRSVRGDLVPQLARHPRRPLKMSLAGRRAAGRGAAAAGGGGRALRR